MNTAKRNDCFSNDTLGVVTDAIKQLKISKRQEKVIFRDISKGNAIRINLNNVTEKRRERRCVKNKLDICAKRKNRRTLESIVESGAYRIELLPPNKYHYNCDKEKSKLQCIMAFGEIIENHDTIFIYRKERRGKTNVSILPSKEERIDELLEEITSRINFMDQMKNLGEERFNQQIQQEISSKIRSLESITKNLFDYETIRRL